MVPHGARTLVVPLRLRTHQQPRAQAHQHHHDRPHHHAREGPH